MKPKRLRGRRLDVYNVLRDHLESTSPKRYGVLEAATIQTRHIAAILGMKPSNVSAVLRELKAQGIVTERDKKARQYDGEHHEGRKSYCIAKPALPDTSSRK